MIRTRLTQVYLIIKEKIITQTLQEFITNLEYKVCVLDSVSELLNILKREGESKATVIIEENVFKGKEKKFIEKMAKQFNQLNIIMITDNRPEISIKEAISHRIFGFLHKPISLLELELLLVRMTE